MDLVPAAAAAPVAPVVTGPPRPVRVVAAGRSAVYLDTADPACPALALVARTAVHTPCALVLAAARVPPVGAGAAATAGGGLVDVAGTVVRVARWWRPPRPRGLDRVPPGRRAAVAAWLARCVPDPLDSPGRAAVRLLAAALAGHGEVGPPVRALLGRGQGLTPVGDDVLAGAAVTLAALDSQHPQAAPRAALNEAVAAAAGSTTFVSAALLHHAARGECVPQVAGLLAAVADPERLTRAAGALLSVGHSSGAGLAHGVACALAATAGEVQR